jgi:hypothetical protein
MPILLGVEGRGARALMRFQFWNCKDSRRTGIGPILTARTAGAPFISRAPKYPAIRTVSEEPEGCHRRGSPSPLGAMPGQVPETSTCSRRLESGKRSQFGSLRPAIPGRAYRSLKASGSPSAMKSHIAYRVLTGAAT